MLRGILATTAILAGALCTLQGAEPTRSPGGVERPTNVVENIRPWVTADPCAPCPGPSRQWKLFCEEQAEVVTVMCPVVVRERQKYLAPGPYATESWTEEIPVTRWVSKTTKEVVMTKVRVPEKRLIEVPVTSYQKKTDRWVEEVDVRKVNRWWECEASCLFPCVDVPRLKREVTWEKELRERCKTTYVPVTELRTKVVNDYVCKEVPQERLKTECIPVTEMQKVTRTKMVPTCEERERDVNKIVYEPHQITRIHRKPIWVEVDERGVPLHSKQGPAPSNQLPPPKPLPQQMPK